MANWLKLKTNNVYCNVLSKTYVLILLNEPFNVTCELKWNHTSTASLILHLDMRCKYESFTMNELSFTRACNNVWVANIKRYVPAILRCYLIRQAKVRQVEINKMNTLIDSKTEVKFQVRRARLVKFVKCIKFVDNMHVSP